MASSYVIPPIGGKGTFQFKSPFNSLYKGDIEYTVYAIRSLKEIIDSGEDPYEYIYKAAGLTEDDMTEDLTDNVPIIVLSNGANEYAYVPADMLSNMPDVSGVKYQQKMLAINIGHLPLDYDLELAKDTIKDAVMEVLGIQSTVEVVATSAVRYITEDEHNAYQKLMETRKTVNMSYRTRYKILLETYNKLSNQLKKLEQCAIQKFATRRP